jgi:hypothetical protein
MIRHGRLGHHRANQSAIRSDLLDLALREEPDKAAVRRPEWKRGIFSSRKGACLKPVHRPPFPDAAMARKRPLGEMAKLCRLVVFSGAPME